MTTIPHEMQLLINDALTKVPRPFKKYRKYCVGVADREVTLKMPSIELKCYGLVYKMAVSDNKTVLSIEDRCEIGKEPTATIKLFIPDFRCDRAMSFKTSHTPQ